MAVNATTIPYADPRRCALLVVDKQRGYLCDQHAPWLTGNGPWVQSLDVFIAAARSSGVTVVFTRMTESTQVSPRNIRKIMKSTRTATISEPGTPSYEWFGVPPTAGDHVVDKLYYDAFAGTGLSRFLTASGVDTVVLVGAYAGRCVLATAFGANARGFFVVLVPDLTLGHPDSPHEAEVSEVTVGAVLGWTRGSSELLSRWSG